MADEVVLKFTLDTENVEKEINDIKKGLTQTEKTGTTAFNKIDKEAKEATASVKKVGAESKNLMSSLASIAERLPFGGIISQIRSLGQDMQGVGASAVKSGNMIGMGMKLALGPLALLIAAIVGLIAYFKRTDEGAAKLEGIMRGIGLVFDALMEPIERFGQAIFEAFENPKEAIATLVDYVIKAVEIMYLPFITLGKVIKAVFTGDLAGAQQAITDAADTYKNMYNTIVDGLNSMAKSAQDLADKAKLAYEEGKKLALLFDNLEDKQRDFRLETAKSESQVKQLLVAARNRTLSAQERLDIIKQASQIEAQNAEQAQRLASENFKLTMLDVLAKEQVYELTGLTLEQIQAQINNGGKIAELDKLSIGYLKQKIKDRAELGKIEDDQADKLIEAEIALQGAFDKSAETREKIKVRYDALIEQQYQEEIKAEGDKNKLILTEYEKMLRDKQIANEDFTLIQLQEQITLLENQKAINEKFGKETIDLDKAIVEAQIKLQEYLASEAKKIDEQALKDSQKSKEQYLTDLEKEYAMRLNVIKNAATEQLTANIGNAEKQKELSEDLTQDLLKLEVEKQQKLIDSGKLTNDELFKAQQDLDEKKRQLEDNRRKQEEDKERQHQSNLNSIKQKGIEITQELLNNAVDIQNERQQQELQSQIDNLSLETDAQIQSLDRQRQARIISDELYEAKKKALESQRIEREKAIKRQQFEADKRAQLIKVAIDTAAGIVKTFANLGYPLGIVPAALLAAQGAAQAAIIQSQPVPKFEKGGIVGGQLHSQGGTLIEAEKGEYVINRHSTAKHKDLIESINKDEFDSYLKNSYIVPALREAEQRKRKERLNATERLIRANENNTVDLTYLERITKNNKSVQIANSKELASEIARKIQFKNDYIR